MIDEILNNYNTIDGLELFKNTVDELCAKGIAKGCYQDYGVLTDVIGVLSDFEQRIAKKLG